MYFLYFNESVILQTLLVLMCVKANYKRLSTHMNILYTHISEQTHGMSTYIFTFEK